MPISFLTLPRELRDMIYKLSLLREGCILPWDHSYYGRGLSSGLLLANKIINREAAMILYQNRFDFTNLSPDPVTGSLHKLAVT